jgi:phosphoribosyl 1,2-cyclic phosphodiesterase
MEPVGFIVSSGPDSIGIVTDIGMPTALVRERLKKCRAVVVESNHDEEMLRNSKRPWQLKQRISGRQGHLSNARAAQMLAEIAGPQLQRIFLAHLSSECNRQDIAWRATRDALARAGHTHVTISMTFPGSVSEVWAAA